LTLYGDRSIELPYPRFATCDAGVPIAQRAASRLQVVAAACGIASSARRSARSAVVRALDRDVGVVATVPAFTTRSVAPRTVPRARGVVENARRWFPARVTVLALQERRS
jgi:hypothetical protein